MKHAVKNIPYLTHRWYFRKSTKEWIWYFILDIPVYLHGSYIFSGKTKLQAFKQFLKYRHGMYKDYYSAMKDKYKDEKGY